jgi:hypothetical protein
MSDGLAVEQWNPIFKTSGVSKVEDDLVRALDLEIHRPYRPADKAIETMSVARNGHGGAVTTSPL